MRNEEKLSIRLLQIVLSYMEEKQGGKSVSGGTRSARWLGRTSEDKTFETHPGV